MKTHVAIYSTREKALEALEVLNEKNFSMDRVSLVGKADIIDDHIEVKTVENLKLTPLLISVGSGIVLGLLVGIGLITIPGFNFFAESGIFITTLIGFDIGLIVGAIGTVFTILFRKDKFVKYKERLVGKNFMVVVNGTLDEIEDAERILHTEGIHQLRVA